MSMTEKRGSLSISDRNRLASEACCLLLGKEPTEGAVVMSLHE